MCLENTTWTISGLEKDITVTFKADHRATTTHLHGHTFDQYWDETGGAFAILCPNSTITPEIDQVYSGSYFGNQGHGCLFNFGMGESQTFTMKKNT